MTEVVPSFNLCLVILSIRMNNPLDHISVDHKSLSIRKVLLEFSDGAFFLQ